MKFGKAILLSAVLTVSISVTATASTVVIGENQGTACYKEAQHGRSGNASLQTCNAALTDGLLTYKDIAATYVNRGIIRSARGDYTGAVADYDRAIHMNPKLAEAFANRGTVFIRRAKYHDALVEFDRALSLDLEMPASVYYNRAIVYEHIGETTKAYFDFKKAVELRPNWNLPQIELARFSVKSD